MKMTINGVRSTERVYLNLRASAGYTSEEKKLERNDSKINLTIQLKKFSNIKIEVKNMRLFAREVFMCVFKTRTYFAS